MIRKCGLFLLFLLACACKGKTVYRQVAVANPPFIENKLFRGTENISLPRFRALREKYQLDTVLKGETNELKRILLLRHWIKSKMLIGLHNLYNGPADPEIILDSAMKGSVFHCGHFTTVQNAVLNAYGYVTRCLGAGPGLPGFADQHHAINEVWLGDYHKWFLCDAKYDHHFEKKGIPLSALEVRAAYLQNQANDIDMVKGPGRISISGDREVKETKAEFAQTYTWLEWEVHSDRYSSFPDQPELLLMYRDDYSKQHVWLWNGKPHWAINTAYVQYSDSAAAIEWTPNTIFSTVAVSRQVAAIRLHSQTPNFENYQMKTPGPDKWTNCDSVLSVNLNKFSEMEFRTMNSEAVPGPVHRIRFAGEPL